MSELFSTVLNMSLIASLTAVVVLLVRWCLRARAPRWISYVLWAVVLIRLLVPVSFSAPVSLFSLVPAYSADAVGQSGRLSRLDVTGAGRQESASQPAPQQIGTGGTVHAAPAGQGEAENPSTETPANPAGWRGIAAAIWLCGAAAMGGFLALHYVFSALRLRRLRPLPDNDKIRRAEKLLPLRRKVQICACRMFATPVVFGLFRPRIVLPRGFDWEDVAAQHILLHERVHISRWDNLVKIAATVAVCIHWFNPVVWLCFWLCSDDMEASCDERVLKILGEDSRQDYARSLLSIAKAQNRRMGVVPFLAFGESNLKQRVGNILKYHKKTLLSVLAAVLAVLLVGCSLLANPSAPAQPSAADDGQDASQSEGGSGQETPQEMGIPVKDQAGATLYVLYHSTTDAEPFYFPLPRLGVSQMTASWLQEQLQQQADGTNMTPLEMDEITVEGRGATVSLLDSENLQIAKEYGSGERWLSSVAMTLLQNSEIDTVRFTLEGEPFPSAAEADGYTPADLVLPPMSQDQIQALYDTVTLEQLQANLAVSGESDGSENRNPIDRWDLKGDAKAKAILDAIFAATIWNNVPESDFDSIAAAPNAFLLNAAYNQAPNIFWYQNGTEPNTFGNFAVLTALVDDHQCIPQQILEETARQLFGDEVQITPESPRYGYYREYAMAYTPYHMGGWYPDIFLLDYTEQGNTVEATVAYGELYGSTNNAMNTLTDMEEEQSIRGREQRHRFTLQRTADGYRITGYHAVDTVRDMIARSPDYYAYTAICGGLAFFDWDGAQNLTPDQLYRWLIAGYSPGVNDTELSTQTVEQYFYAYTGYHPQDPSILRQSQYYDEQAGVYRTQVDGVIGRWDSSRQYWCDYGTVTYSDEDTALAPVRVYADEGRTQLLADGVIKMKYQEDPTAPWVADGFSSN
ncbi:MAG: M56 family metallopeptidase [Oscillospiraceae bacterium]|nr:M56 family metallopeptidase [Oscillospiraceae bacterium]